MTVESAQPTSSYQLSDPSCWVHTYGDYLYGFALMRLRDEHAAQDAVQETLLAALQARHNFNGHSSERTWLTAILKFKIIDHLRRVIKQQPAEEALPYEQEQLFTDDEHDHPAHWRSATAPGDWGVTPVCELEQKEFWAAFQRCFDKLPPRLATLFALREFDEEPTDVVCKELAISETNLWVMLYRARMHLRRCLEQTWFAHS